MPEVDLQTIISDLNGRIRTLEARYSNLGERLLIVNQNMIEEYKRVHREMRALDSDIKEVKRTTFQIKEALGEIVKQLHNFAKKENIKVLEKYINMWNPINFVSEDDVKRIVKDVLEKNNGKKKVKNARK